MTLVYINNVVTDENQTSAEFQVRLDAPATAPITVSYNNYAGTAVYGDFVENDGSLTFAAGETVKTVKVQLVRDTVAEGLEQFYVGIGVTSGTATVAKAVGTATLIDNDAPTGTPVISISDMIVDEADKEASFVITLDRPSTSLVSLAYATQAGTALAGSDFVGQSGSLTLSSP